MGKYQDLTKDIPWNSFGPETPTSIVGRSLVPVGILPFEPQLIKNGKFPVISHQHPDSEKFLMNIVGTAIQAGNGKLVTCGHVVEALFESGSKGYILAKVMRKGLVVYNPYSIQEALRYVDPRTNEVNLNVDLAVLIIPAKSTGTVPYEIPNVEWGDSTQLGIGDSVIIGGYPDGTDMFKYTETNRGIIQPTFYSGIVSAILPATNPKETRIIQVSIPVGGGISGGAMFDPKTGKLLGMITSGVDYGDIPQPITYALPSEIIAPYVEVITFKTK